MVTSLRLWIQTDMRTGEHWPVWADGFARAGLDEAATMAFDTLCRIVVTTTDRMDIRSVPCRSLGFTEILLLRVLALLQRGQVDAADVVLSASCPPTSVRIALLPAYAFALSLASRCLVVNAPPCGACRHTAEGFAMHIRSAIH